jgi:hypothetical protein
MDYKELPFDELRLLHRDVGALLAERRHEALQQLKDQAESLGVNLRELIPKKTRKRRAREDDSA